MYAVIEVGGKQYQIKKDDIIEVEKQIAGEGEDISLDKVLLACDDADIKVGQPYLKASQVTATVLKHIKGEKKIAFKYRRRKAYHRKKGHRQQLTRLKIKAITVV